MTNPMITAQEMTDDLDLEIDRLIEKHEDKLRDMHAEDYFGLDDDMPDDFDRFLSEFTDWHILYEWEAEEKSGVSQL